MAEIREGLYALNAGEISKNALAHIDLAKLKVACEREEDFLPLVLGPAMMRPGTEYLDGIKDNLPGRLIEFKKDEDALALWIPTNDGGLQVYDAIGERFVARISVSAAVTNGDFSSDINFWTDVSEPGGSIFWTIGWLGLLGTGSNYGIARQQVSVFDPGVEHALRIKIVRGDVAIRIGSSAGGNDHWNIQVPEGEYSLAFVPFDDFWIELAAFHEWPSYVESVQVEGPGRMTLIHPWTNPGDLGLIREARSEDVLFVACRGHQQQRLERRNTDDMRSWAIALYRANDGPFMPANLGSTTITPSATTGEISLIANRNLFHPGQVGALFRLTHAAQQATAILAGADQFTGNIRISGIEPGRAFTVSISGRTASTLTLQRSFTDPGAWVDVQTYTANGSFTFDDGLDNQIYWYRIGIKTGNYGGDIVSAALAHTGSQTGIVRVLQVIDQLQVIAHVLTHLGDAAATSDWAEGEWSDYRGWPVAVAIHGGRLEWQSAVRAQGSISDAFHSFDDTVTGDSAPINRSTVASRPQWMISADYLLIGSFLHEVSVRASAFDEPLTATAFNPRTRGDHGAAPLRAVLTDGQVVYVSRDRSRVFALTFDGQRADYTPKELTRLNQEICQSGIVDIAVQQQPDTRFYLALGDGRIVVLVHEQNEDVSALVPWSFENAVAERVAVLPARAGTAAAEDRVYVLMRRGVGETRGLERFALRTEALGGEFNKIMDGHRVYSGPPTTTLTGYSHLEGEVIVAWADGRPLVTRNDGIQVISGNITLPTPVVSATAGKPYFGFLKTSKLAYASQKGTSLAASKRVGPAGLVMNNVGWAGVRVGRDFDHLNALPRVYRGRPIAFDEVLPEWDDIPSAFNGGWGADPRVCIRVEAPYPCTILAIAFGEQVNEGEDVPAPRGRTE